MGENNLLAKPIVFFSQQEIITIMNSLKKQKFLFIFIIFLFLFLLTIIFDYGLSYLKPDPKVRTFEVENFREQIVVRLMSHPLIVLNIGNPIISMS